MQTLTRAAAGAVLVLLLPVRLMGQNQQGGDSSLPQPSAGRPVYRQTFGRSQKPSKPAAQPPMYNIESEREKPGKSVVTPAPKVLEKAHKSVVASRSSGKSEASTTGAKPISSWPTGKKLIALTYDDGPHPTITPKLIELLKAKDVPATFYLLGQQVQAYPKLTARLAAEGFELANHTYKHPDLKTKSEEVIYSELKKTEELITSASGVKVRNMRPPFGNYNSKVVRICEEFGYPIILWDVDTNDWQKRSASAMINTIMSGTRDGSIILFHDRYQASVDASAYVIDALRAKGFEFVTVSQLLAQPRLGTGTSSLPSPMGQ